MLNVPSWLDQAILTYGYLAVLVAVALEGAGVPFPGETSLVAAAVFAGIGRPLNIVGVIAAAALGAMLGDNTGYAIGRFGGYPLVRRIGGLERRLAPAQRYFARHGSKTVFFGRYVAILRTYVALLAGLNKMPWRTFVLFDAAADIVWATIYGVLGYVLGRNIPLLVEVLDVLGVGGVVLAVLVVLAIITVVLVRRRAILRGFEDDEPPSPSS
jgi:membrane protein DedA with SNARE-associated domain